MDEQILGRTFQTFRRFQSAVCGRSIVAFNNQTELVVLDDGRIIDFSFLEWKNSNFLSRTYLLSDEFVSLHLIDRKITNVTLNVKSSGNKTIGAAEGSAALVMKLQDTEVLFFYATLENYTLFGPDRFARGLHSAAAASMLHSARNLLKEEG